MTMTESQDVQQAANEHYRSRFEEIGRLLRLARECLDHEHWDWLDAINGQILEMPLSVELVAIYPQSEECEWSILLGTGGPADRVLVATDMHGTIDRASYQFQDWFTPWTDAHGQDEAVVRDFACVFYLEPRDALARVLPGILP